MILGLGLSSRWWLGFHHRAWDPKAFAFFGRRDLRRRTAEASHRRLGDPVRAAGPGRKAATRLDVQPDECHVDRAGGEFDRLDRVESRPEFPLLGEVPQRHRAGDQAQHAVRRDDTHPSGLGPEDA
jgi:hypothetical protein